ncbi:hypothetical protein DW765_04675 [Phocaeicola vulgatus]|nr:hypothetical protein [Salmonella enterica subsp. enterica]RHE20094.1 hypothetical protein DW765_04675 [Phocaeicola vulgatus]
MAIIQPVKHSDSLRQFCMDLLYGDWQRGADFTVLPDVYDRKGKGSVRGNFELSPYFSCGILIIYGN